MSVPPSRLLLVSAFLAVYIIWGSTYLAIQMAIETLPSFLMAGVRFLIAGGAMYLYARWVKKDARPTAEQWRSTAIVGALMLVVGNGCVVFSEHLLPSSLVALIVATVPLWMAVLEWMQSGRRPNAGVTIGVLGGFAGVALLIGPGKIAGVEQINPLGAAVVLAGSLGWATGSLQSRRRPLPSSAILSTGMQMFSAGIALTLLAIVTGELGAVHPETFSLRSLGALAYLIVFGSLVGFTSYAWLLQVSTPALVSTYAYVNPVVAVFLGWAIAGETITARTMIAATIIVSAVAVMTTWKGQKKAA